MKVYALMVLAHNTASLKLEVNYNISFLEIHQKLIKKSLPEQELGLLDFSPLGYVCSWVRMGKPCLLFERCSGK